MIISMAQELNINALSSYQTGKNFNGKSVPWIDGYVGPGGIKN